MDFLFSNSLYSVPLIQGAPESTNNMPMYDGSIETYSNIAKQSRKQLNFHNTNGTDVPSMLNAIEAGVIGSGINIQSRLSDPILNEQFEKLLKEHSRKGAFHTREMFSRNEAFRQIIRFKHLSGGVIIRHHYSNSWAIPYKLDILGVDMIDTSKTDRKNLKNGIQRNKYGAITHLWLYTDEGKRTSLPYSMKNMTYHMTSWMSLDQYTAVSRLVTILPTLDGMLQYASAEVKAAIERAKAGVYWSTELYGVILDAINAEYRDARADLATKVEEARKLLEGLAKRGVSAHGATPIPKDDTIHKVDSKTDSVYDVLTNHSQKAMASSVGGSSVSVYKDIEKGNYSSIKAAISFDEEFYKIEFNRLEEDVIDEYLRRLFAIGVQIGRIKLTTRRYFSDPEQYHSWDILRQSKRIIDEAKYATAVDTQLRSGTTTLEYVYGENGKDYVTEMRKQIARDIEVETMRREMYKEAGLEPPVTGQQPQQGVTQ